MNVAYISSNWGTGSPGKPPTHPAFSLPIITELDNRGHNVLLYQHTDDVGTNLYQLGQLKAQADRVFVDWVQPPLETVLQQWGPNDAPVFVRAHRIEMYNEAYLQSLPWDRVACLFFIAEHVQQRFTETLITQPQRTCNVGHVGVDTEFWTPGEGKRSLEPPWRILLAGSITPKKRQYSAVQMLADLPEEFVIDLVGSGGHQGYGLSEYHHNISDLVHELGLESRLTSEAHCPPEQLREKAREAHFVLSASNEEGCATIVAEAMACGCVPLVNCWRGARAMYPPEWVWNTPLGLYGLCNDWAAMGPTQREELSAEMVEWAQRYDARAIARNVVDTITGPVDARSVGEWYSSDEQFDHMVEQYGNSRQQEALQAALSLLPPPAEGIQVLDVGCSVGYTTHGIEAAGYKCIGIDLSARALEWASAHGPGLFIQADVSERPPMGPFDLVTLIDCLEHVPAHKTEVVLVRALAALNPGGHVLIRIPHGCKDRQVVEVTLHPKVLRKALRSHGATVETFGKCGENYFEIVARKAG